MSSTTRPPARAAPSTSSIGAGRPSEPPSPPAAAAVRPLIAGGVVGVLALVGGGAWAAWSFFATGAQPAEALPDSHPRPTPASTSTPAASRRSRRSRPCKKFPAFKDEIDLDTDDDIRKKIFDEVQDSASLRGPRLRRRHRAVARRPGRGRGASTRWRARPTPVFVVQVKDAGRGRGRPRRSSRDVRRRRRRGRRRLGDRRRLGRDRRDRGDRRSRSSTTPADGAARRRRGLPAVDRRGRRPRHRHHVRRARGRRVPGRLPRGTGRHGPRRRSDALASSQRRRRPATSSREPDASATPTSDACRRGAARALEDFEGAAATVRFDDGALEIEVAGDAASDRRRASRRATGGDDVVGTLPEDTAAAIGVGLAEGWFARCSTSRASTAPRCERRRAARRGRGRDRPRPARGHRDPARRGDARSPSARDIDPEALVNSDGPARLPVGVKIQGDPDGDRGRPRQDPAPRSGDRADVLEHRERRRPVAIGPNADYSPSSSRTATSATPRPSRTSSRRRRRRRGPLRQLRRRRRLAGRAGRATTRRSRTTSSRWRASASAAGSTDDTVHVRAAGHDRLTAALQSRPTGPRSPR